MLGISQTPKLAYTQVGDDQMSFMGEMLISFTKYIISDNETLSTKLT